MREDFYIQKYRQKQVRRRVNPIDLQWKKIENGSDFVRPYPARN
jgi:hypothetical protein